MKIVDGEKVYGFSDEELLAHPTVYRGDLFAGKTVFVSGAGSGLGKGIAYLFARLGANMIVCGRDMEKLDHAANCMRKAGAEVDVHQLNIRDPEQVDAVIKSVFNDHGNLDVLVNNAGGQFPQPAIDFTVKGWNAVIDTNLNGTWYMTQATAKCWQDSDQQGAIVNIVADIWRGLPDMAHTAAARAGVIYMSKTVAVEWAQNGIRVNCLAPGCCESEGFNRYPPEGSKSFLVSNPMLRAGDVMDVAEGAVYLSAPSAKFITGEVLTIDGGQQLWGDPWAFKKPDWAKIDI